MKIVFIILVVCMKRLTVFMDRQTAATTFCEVTGTDIQYANQILETCNWDVEVCFTIL